MVGYSMIYNTLDNNRNPTRGLLAEMRLEKAQHLRLRFLVRRHRRARRTHERGV